eukprot:14541843-Alexandrium_andersonii.AAC.1
MLAHRLRACPCDCAQPHMYDMHVPASRGPHFRQQDVIAEWSVHQCAVGAQTELLSRASAATSMCG